MNQLAVFDMKCKCPSYNIAFKINHRTKKVYLSKVAHDFKRDLKMATPHLDMKKVKYLLFNIDVMQDWFYKNGKLKRQDVQNMDKLIIDAVCDKLGVDDSIVIQSSIQKIQYVGDPYIVIMLYSEDEIPMEEYDEQAN